MPATHNRRVFLKIAGAVGALAVPGGVYLFLKTPSQETVKIDEGRLRRLTAAQAGTIGVITSRILPTDETPGADDAGVVYAIDAKLFQNRSLAEFYTIGLTVLEDDFGKVTGSEHPLRDSERRDVDNYFEDLLRRSSNAPASAGNGEPELLSQFFTQVAHDTYESVYTCDVGWKILGFNRPQSSCGHPDYDKGPR